MTYESLLLNLGGGVVPSGHRSKPYAGAAALLIGIGGTGVDVLTKIKRKVYQDLIPDDPNDPIPRYDHIQFLAIDSDEDVIAKMKGRAKIALDRQVSEEILKKAVEKAGYHVTGIS